MPEAPATLILSRLKHGTNFSLTKPNKLAKALNSLSLPIAIIYTNELIERREENDLRIYRYALNDIGATLFCTVSLTRDDKVADLQLSLE